VIGQFAQAIVSSEVQNHEFAIRSSVPNVKVCLADYRRAPGCLRQANPLVVEEEKEPRLKGFYLHPELYGAPAEKQTEWARHPQMMKQIKRTKTESSREVTQD